MFLITLIVVESTLVEPLCRFNEYQTMIRLGEEWSTCKAQHENYVNAAFFLEKRNSGFACIHLPIPATGKRETFAAVACR